MMKTALITGATDGIGKATAISLAKRGYQIHFTGRNKSKGDDVLDILKSLNPKGNHELFIYDLMDEQKNIEFLNNYSEKYRSLDFLFLNANPYPKKEQINPTEYDDVFLIGFISRYLYSVILNDLLGNTRNSRVMHIGGVSASPNINFNKLENPKFNSLKTMTTAYTADAFLTYHINDHKEVKTSHVVFEPGAVNTQQIKNSNILIKILARLANMAKPENIGEIIADIAEKTDVDDIAKKIYSRTELRDIPPKLKNVETYNKLMDIAKELTGISLEDM